MAAVAIMFRGATCCDKRRRGGVLWFPFCGKGSQKQRLFYHQWWEQMAGVLGRRREREKNAQQEGLGKWKKAETQTKTEGSS